MKDKLLIILQFVLLVLAQVLVFNHVQLFGWMGIYLYVLFIIVLPTTIGHVPLLILGALIGFAVDAFSGMYGLHAAATILTAFARPYVMRIFVSREQMEQTYPSYKTFGMAFYYYAVVLVLLHHFTLFMLEAFNWHLLPQALLHTVLSALLTMLLIVLLQQLKSFRRY